jgi:hypothetical protein
MKSLRLGAFAPTFLIVLAASCDGDGGTIVTAGNCTIDESLLASGGPGPDGIPALTYPTMVPAEDQDALYLRDDDRVLGVVVDGVARAYPYGPYDALGNNDLLFSQERVDRSRPIKEGVLGVRVGDDGGKGFRDQETGTLWDIAGRAVQGELEGEVLSAADDAYVLCWFAWRFFQPDAEIFAAQ